MSLAEQIQRVDGSQTEMLKAIAQAFGISVAGKKIDAVAALVNSSSKFKQDALLASDTAALLGLSASATPDDAFEKLGQFRGQFVNEYVWRKYVPNVSTKVYRSGTGDWKVLSSRAADTLFEIEYGTTLTVDDNGVLRIKNPTKTQISYNTKDNAQVLLGKYWQGFDTSGKPFSYVTFSPASATINAYYDGTYWVYVNGPYTAYEAVSVSKTSVSYVSSENEEAYPPEAPGNYEYDFLGAIGDKARITYGSYVGTGTAGESNPTVITCTGRPKFVCIIRDGAHLENELAWAYMAFWCWGLQYVCVFGDLSRVRFSVSGNKFSLYHDQSSPDAFYQMNSKDEVYRFIAICD